MNFSHIKKNKQINMVDISEKGVNSREAHAYGLVKFNFNTFKKIIDDEGPKGEIFNTARLAGIMAAKKTHELIPLCHNITINSVKINFKINSENSTLEIFTIVKSNTKTGVEMEALTGCATCCLTLYDMCKSFDKTITIKEIKLTYKSGGKSGEFKNDNI